VSVVKVKLIMILLVVSLAACDSRVGGEQVVPIEQLSQTVTEAITDLSGRLDVPSDQIELVSEKTVTWRNGGIGCPKPDMMYSQALVEGKLIVLRVDGKSYQYHSGGDHPPFYCENPEKPAARPGAD